MNLDEIKYPIGRFKSNKNTFDTNYIKGNIEILKKFPSKLEDEIKILNPRQINTPYREKGWTILQLIHHLADSHTIAYIRCKLAVNQNKISVNDYIPDKWANHIDAKENNYKESLFIIKGLHSRWTTFFVNLSEKKFQYKYYYTARKKFYTIYDVLGLYAWHSNHHLQHIKNVKIKMKW